MGSYYNGDEWRWHRWSGASFKRDTITVSDLSDEERKERDAKVKRGARVVPFGFSRILAPEQKPADTQPQLIFWDEV